jgi:hypothetical protein
MTVRLYAYMFPPAPVERKRTLEPSGLASPPNGTLELHTSDMVLTSAQAKLAAWMLTAADVDTCLLSAIKRRLISSAARLSRAILFLMSCEARCATRARHAPVLHHAVSG